MTDTVLEVDGEGQSELELAVAEQIALLSQASDAPLEFEPTGRAFDAREVDFTSSAWMACLAEVQGWLRLPDELPLEDANGFLEALARGLDFDNTEVAVESADGRFRFSEVALDRLSGRLQRALQFQEAFIADLEADGGSQASATGRWREAWDDDEAEIEEVGGPVSARAQTWNINDFSSRASRGKLNLSPSYQRGDVWPTSDSQMLIESIMRGIPLPSVIILKPEGNAPYEVVDGKQRLTSILRFIGKHPRAIELVKDADVKHKDAGFERLLETDYPTFRRKWKNLMGEQLTAAVERANYFPFRLRTGSAPLQGELAFLQGKYYTQIKQHRLQIADDEVEVRDVFENVTDYKIPLIEYSKATPRQIHEVFNLYNRQGKHLNAEEIRNALYHDVDLMRALIVAAGDNRDVSGVAGFLEPEWPEIQGISQSLEDYQIGDARYRHTKVLSWLVSMLLVDSIEAGKANRRSTSRHIDWLLQRIQGNPKDPMRRQSSIVDVLRLVSSAMGAHSAVVEAWAPRFRDTKTGVKWQELQLIASVLGVALATTVLGDEIEDRVTLHARSLSLLTNSDTWQRPEKTQTASQWDYIARIALWIVEELEVDASEVSAELTRRFGHTPVPTLQSVLAESRYGGSRGNS